MRKEMVFKQLGIYKKMLEDKGYRVIYIGLYGSQNYNLDDEKSDIDVKAIVLPSLHDIIFRKVISKTIEFDTGNIDVKDLITFYNVIKKGNFSYIESIDTEYYIGDKKVKELFKQFRPNLKSILGAMYEKRKALTHEYPSKVNEIKKWGFDPKQYHHIIRLYELLSFDIYNQSKLSYLKYERKLSGEMIDIKRNRENLSRKYVEMESDRLVECAKTLIPTDYQYKTIDIDNEISRYIEIKLKMELRNTNVTSAREYRTFNTPIPKNDLKKFPILEQYQGEDISYIVYEEIEIL